MPILDPSRTSYRFIILAFNCLLTLGSYYAFDMPSVLQNELISQVITPFSPSGSQTLYNSWYTAYAWCNMCMCASLSPSSILPEPTISYLLNYL